MPQELFNELEKSAKDSRRSLTQEAIVLLEKALLGFDIQQAKNRRKKLVNEISRNRKLSEDEAKLAIQWIRQDRDVR